MTIENSKLLKLLNFILGRFFTKNILFRLINLILYPGVINYVIPAYILLFKFALKIANANVQKCANIHYIITYRLLTIYDTPLIVLTIHILFNFQ